MGGSSAIIPIQAWYGDQELTLTFPDGWEVETLSPRGGPPLTPAQIEAAFTAPIGTGLIREMARGRKSAAIVVDDLSRPTPAAALLPTVLEELQAAGVPKAETRIVVGGGSHRPMDAGEIAKKVGAQVAADYQVSNHDFFAGNLQGYGTLPGGLPIYIDPVVAAADFKICVGGLYPHSAVGFGGGSKLILPGVSGFASMFYFHTFSASRGFGNVERNGASPDHRDLSEEVAARIGLDMVVNAVLNSRRQIAGLFVGDFVQAQRQGARCARQIYATRIPPQLAEETDLLLVNSYPLDSDAIQTTKALWPRTHFPRAYTVAINPATDGTTYHGLFDRVDYARFCAQRAAQPPVALPPPHVGRQDQLHVWSTHFPADGFHRKLPDAILFRTWQELMDGFAPALPARARVAIFPCTPLQVLDGS